MSDRSVRRVTLLVALAFAIQFAVILGGFLLLQTHEDRAVDRAKIEDSMLERRLWTLLCAPGEKVLPIRREPFCSQLLKEAP